MILSPPRRCLAGLFVALMGCSHAAESAPSPRPMIWVTAADRAPILAKIETQPWARAAFEAMQARVQDAIAQHQRDPDAFLRGLPLVPDSTGPQYHPTLARIGGNQAEDSGRETRGKFQRFLLLGVDCGVLYFLTRDEAYARCAADILHVSVEAMVRMKPSDSTNNGGLIYPEDHLYEARALGPLLPLIYDFVHGYLTAGAKVHSLVSRRPGAFSFAHAQQVFRTYARLAIDHGIIDCNWPVLEMPSLAHNVLALDDPAERTRLLAYVTHQNSAHQDSLKKVVAEYAAPGAVWPESLQYSGGVSSLATYLVALMRRQDSSTRLPEAFAHIPLSLARLREFRFPNGENIRFGDGPRRSGEAFDAYEIAYALGRREGDPQLQQTFGALINLGVTQGKYNRAQPRGHSTGASVYLGPLQLLWFAPEISGQMKAPAPRPTDVLPFAGAVLQRNLAPDGDAAHALMAVVSGGHHVHGHASGMALELYGASQVLGANAGKGTYTSDEHENHRRLFAAYNCVIVNGASRSQGGWVNLGIDTVRQVALEPAVGAAPVSARHSFSLTRFTDKQIPDGSAEQERLVGLVRTSTTTGFYVDVFRSRTRSGSSAQFHDYLYHNVGDSLVLASAQGPVQLADSPDRFAPAAGTAWSRNRSYLFPGWHAFKMARTSPPFAGDVAAQFSAAKLQPAPVHMRLFLPGAAGREYSTALAPATKEAPDPYGRTPTPVLIVRQRGEAWDRPFAAIFAPHSGPTDAGSVQAVTALGNGTRFAGFKVISRLADRALTHYILVLPSTADSFEDAGLGLSFRGRFAVATLDERGDCTELYLGEGSRLRVGKTELTSVSGATTAASAVIRGTGTTVVARAATTLRLPDGQIISSQAPTDQL